MKHAVLKLGGSVLRGAQDADAVLSIISAYEDPLVVVVSALKGVTDRLAAAADRVPSAGAPTHLVARLREEHSAFAEALGAPAAALEAAILRIDRILLKVLAILEGGEEDSMPAILASGERLSATCVALAFVALGRPAPILEPGRAGLVARGESTDRAAATVDLALAGPAIRAALGRLEAAVVPGFYGVDEEGQTLLFGRGGSDYSAAVIAACLGARFCHFVKDVSGLFTADPSIVATALPVGYLSYAEAEALAEGGASILHCRAIEPLRATGVPLRILNGSDACSPTACWAGTKVGARSASREAPLALALAQGPAGSGRITGVCRGGSAGSAALVLSAFETRGMAVRGFSMGADAFSFSVLIDGSRSNEGLRIAHEALFEGGNRQGPRPAHALARAGGVA